MSWKLLQLASPEVPRILAKWSTDDSGYNIQLTDLSRIWSESLRYDGIVGRAREVGCSIDPGEDHEQFKILLGKIGSALDGEDGTTLSVLEARRDDGSELCIELTASLPHPLPRFTWTLYLQRQTEECIETELVTPLLLQASNLRHQIQQLVDELHGKDRVISKICDRLETSGNDLTTVFPGVSNVKTSRKKNQREQLAKYVKGLEDFDEDEWRKGNKISNGDNVGTVMFDEVFRDLPPARGDVNAPGTGRWWEKIGRSLHGPPESEVTHGNSVKPPSKTKQAVPQDNSETEDEAMPDDEFQRQGTPPHLKPTNIESGDQHELQQTANLEVSDQQPPQPNDGDSTTDDEDDLDSVARKPALSKKLPSRVEENNMSQSPKKLGAIGGRSFRIESSSPPTQPMDEASQSPKPLSKLGAIGGRSKAPPSASPPADETMPTNDPPPSKGSKMGTIGGRKAQKPATLPTADESEKTPETAQETSPRQSRTPIKQQTPPPRETSEERADKKRDQLKRELEEKAKAPVKKKRKF